MAAVVPFDLRQAVLGAVAGLAALAALHFLRGFPWSLAAIAGLAVGVFVVYALRIAARLRALYRRDD